ncbi:MAG TPA: hypothetical protein PK986_02915 [Spirochaetota bacterium]|nr:hypothetical protein [Spirochaetota bacterium]HQO39399.1 hypothetical protein [Spirochaetota bacterium]
MDNTETTDYNRFRLFYVEAIMHDSSFPQLNRIRPIFEHLTIEEFLDLVDRVFTEDNYELTQQFLYFLLLFRDMEHLQKFMNSPRFTIDRLERLIIFTFGYCSINDNSTERIIDEILFFLDNSKLYDLAINSKYIQTDKLLLFMILSKFEPAMLNKYFTTVKDISSFINYFLNLPDEILRSIISRNYHLFQYIMLMMSESDSGSTVPAEFFEKYRADIDQFSKLSDIIRTYKKTADLNKDRDLPFNMRDMNRISFLVNMVREVPDPVKAVEYFAGEGVFIDEMEKKIVMAVVTDPMMKGLFSRYDSVMDTVLAEE